MTALRARIEAAIRLLFPDEMTPTARNVLLRILEDETTEAIEEPPNHWIIDCDSGWGCTGCDWAESTLGDYWRVHERPGHVVPF